MVQDRKLFADEARRIAQHEAVKGAVRRDVNQAIAQNAHIGRRIDRDEIQDVGRELERRAVDEVASTEAEIARARRGARIAQIIDYVFFVVYALIVVEIVLELTGARESNGFKSFMDTITTPFLAPFRGLFRDPAIGEHRVMFSYLAALGVYLLVHLAIRGLIRVLTTRRTTL